MTSFYIPLVEDDRKTNDAICEYLKPVGHKVIPAYDGGEAPLFDSMFNAV